MKKKISAILLAALTFCSVFAGCGESSNKGNSTGNQDSSSSSSSSESTEDVGGNDIYVDVTDQQQHLVDDDKRLHQNNNDYTQMKPFVVNGQSEYVIIDGAGTSQSKEAIDYLKKQIGMATGYYPSVYFDVNHDMQIDDETLADRTISESSSAKYIVYSHPVLEEKMGVQWETGHDLDYSGYMIKTVGDSVFMYE